MLLFFLFNLLSGFFTPLSNVLDFKFKLLYSFFLFAYLLFHSFNYWMRSKLWFLILLLIFTILYLLFMVFYFIYYSIWFTILSNFFIIRLLYKLWIIIITFIVAIRFAFFAGYWCNFNSLLSFNIFNVSTSLIYYNMLYWQMQGS